ncbi:MAG: hypothetical protein ACI8P0_006094, partial [Planctomycetaceae bacterium]
VAEERFFNELRFVLVDFAPEGHKSARAFGHENSEKMRILSGTSPCVFSYSEASISSDGRFGRVYP